MEAGVAPPTEAETVSVTIELPAPDYEALRQLAEERKISVSQALRQAIRDEIWLRDKIRQGKTLLLRDKDGELLTVSLP